MPTTLNFIERFFVVVEQDYDKAIEMYTKAIDADPKNGIFYANRSLAHLRQENFGYALEDAQKTIKVDPTYTKGYYRRAAAHMSLGKFKLALSDFEYVSLRLRPQTFRDNKERILHIVCNEIILGSETLSKR